MMRGARERLAEFCLRLGGRVRETGPNEFYCVVDPLRVIARLDEFGELCREARGSGIELVRFGQHGKYFFAYPDREEVGFALSYEVDVGEERPLRMNFEVGVPADNPEMLVLLSEAAEGLMEADKEIQKKIERIRSVAELLRRIRRRIRI